jgi:hypothetical protein
VGDGNDDQDDEEPEPVASSASDTTSGTRSMPAFRSVVAVLMSFVRSFSTNSRPALRAAASGGRPRPAALTDAA